MAAVIRNIALASLLFPLAATAGPEAKWLATDHNFGAFNEDLGNATCEFEVVNTGNESMVITGVRVQCGCTTPQYSMDPIAPGDTAVVTVSYDPTGRPGRFSKKIYVDTNTDPRRTTLVIAGTVIAARTTVASRYPIAAGSMNLSEQGLLFGEVKDSGIKNAYITAYNTTRDTLRPAIEGARPYLHTLISPEEVAPGEQMILSATLYGAECDRWGLQTDSLTFYPSGKNGEPVTIKVAYTLTEDFSRLTPEKLASAPTLALSSDMIDFKTIRLQDGSVSESEFEISNRGKSPLIIRRLDCQDPAISLTLPKSMKIKKGKSAKIKVTVDHSRLQGQEVLNSRISLITNDPANPSRIIRAVAEIK